MSFKQGTLEPRMILKPPFTREVPGSPTIQGETIPRRNAQYPDLLTTPEDGVATLYDVVVRAARKFGDANAVGARKLLKTHHETNKITKIVNGKTEEVDKKWTYFELSGYEYLSFKEFRNVTLQLGSGLKSLGLVVNDKVHLFAGTR